MPGGDQGREGERPGQAAAEPTGAPGPPVPGFAFLLSLAMAQFMVVLDTTMVVATDRFPLR